MTRNELKVFEEVDDRLKEAYEILKAHTQETPDCADTLDRARHQVLIAHCDISHQCFLKVSEKWDT